MILRPSWKEETPEVFALNSESWLSTFESTESGSERVGTLIETPPARRGERFLVGLHKEDGGNVSLPDEQTPERDHPRSPGDGKSPEVACLERRLTRGEGSPSGNTFIAARKALRVPPVACMLARGNGFVLECAQMAVAPQIGWRCKHSTNGGEGHHSVKLLVVET